MSSAADTRTSIGNSTGVGRWRDELADPPYGVRQMASNGMPYSISTKRTRRGLQKIRSLRSISSRSVAADATSLATFGATDGNRRPTRHTVPKARFSPIHLSRT